MTLNLLIPFDKTMYASVRCLHQMNLAKGRGGRSSYSGVSATVFGASGHIGKHVTNHLAASGSQLVIPFRGEEKRVLPMKLMADLGQMMFRPHTIKDREADDLYTRELIGYSNVVVNAIGSHRRYRDYTMEEVNLEWPVRLAQLVADKCDGTKLIHITQLACHQPEGRKVSEMLRLQYEAEETMKKIYPETIIVRSAPVYGKHDNYANLLLHENWKSLSFLGAMPALYEGGCDTIVQPVFISDLAKAIARVANHPDAHGQIFEFVGKDRFLLSDLVQHLYDLPFLEKKIVCLHNALGPMEREKKRKITQEIAVRLLDGYFRRTYRPSLLPKFADYIWKNLRRTTWLNEDRFNRLHLSDNLSGENPGFEDLGIEELTDFEQKIYELFYAASGTQSDFQYFTDSVKIPRVAKKEDSKAYSLSLH